MPPDVCIQKHTYPLLYNYRLMTNWYDESFLKPSVVCGPDPFHLQDHLTANGYSRDYPKLKKLSKHH